MVFIGGKEKNLDYFLLYAIVVSDYCIKTILKLKGVTCLNRILAGVKVNELRREKGKPLYKQLKNLLIEKIQTGEFTDSRLPPVRQVASTYSISVNTVLRAYNELQKKGYISGNVGKGTFIITDFQSLSNQNRKTLLKNLIKHALEEAASYDFSIEEFGKGVKEYITRQKDLFSQVKVVFIECNIEQSIYFSNHLELDPSIQTFPILMSELEENLKEVRKKVKRCDLILTSFYHIGDVRRYLGNLGIDIIGINLEPAVSTIVELAKVSPESKIGIVTTSSRFKNIVKGILDEVGLTFKEVYETNTADEEIIRHLVVNCETVLVSPSQKDIVLKYVNAGTKVIEFIFTPDRTSINNIKVALLELKSKPNIKG